MDIIPYLSSPVLAFPFIGEGSVYMMRLGFGV